MGSYAILRLARLTFDQTKNDIDPSVMMLFRGSDKYTSETTANALSVESDMGSDEDFPVTTLVYRIPISTLRDRLELLGFTLPLARSRFEQGIATEIASDEEFQRMYGAGLGLNLSVPSQVTVDDWISSVKEIRDRNFDHVRENELPADVSQLVRYMVRERHQGFAFPDFDTRLALRLALEAFEDHEVLEYDLTDLLLGGWVDTHYDLVAQAEFLIADDFIESRRVVVLTEGETDKACLERSIRLLFPHLADYFTFMDFEGARIGGGAGALANTVKAFIGAGIVNRIVALFDNDTAGSSALQALRKITIPKNVVVKQFPELELALNYPTLGPTGVAHLNVNGLAGSLELYFGRNVLTLPDGTLSPIQWKGFDEALHQYQGEITNKYELQRRFWEQLAICEDDPSRIAEFDWTGITSILRAVFSAFHSVDAHDYVREMNAYREEVAKSRAATFAQLTNSTVLTVELNSQSGDAVT